MVDTTKKYVEGFPTSQVQMEEWKRKYKFDPAAKKWYEPVTAPLDTSLDIKGGAKDDTKDVITKESDYAALVLKTLEDYLATAKEQKPWQEIYAEKETALGIPGKRKALTGITQEVLDVEELLDKLEEDVGTRIGGKLVTGAEERRQLAIEGRPLREQMADLMRSEARAGAGLAGARGELATMMGLEEKERAGAKMGLELLPLFKEALTYETPGSEAARKLAELIAIEEAKKTGEYGVYRPKEPKEPTYPTSYREWELAGKPGTYEKWLEKKEETPTEAGQLAEAKTNMKTQLMTVRETDGYISPENYKKAREAWHQAGFSKRKFNEYFEMFVNPDHTEDYDLGY